MTELAKSDLFFFVTSIAIVVIGVLLSVLIIYLIVIMKKVGGLVDRVREESENVIDDIQGLRSKLQSTAGNHLLFRVPAVFSFIRKIIKKMAK